MDLNEYQNKCRHTAIYISKCNIGGQRISYCTLGLTGEAGEVANLVKKAVRAEGFEDSYYLLSAARTGSPNNVSRLLKEELGDVLWYLAAIAHEAGMTLEDVAQFNLDKLSKRHAPA